MPIRKLFGQTYDEIAVVAKEPLPVDIGTTGTVNIDGDVIAEFDDIEESLGLKDDPAADTDTADVGLIGLFKRLLGKLPALSSGRVPVDGSGVTQPISAAALPLPAGAATETTLGSLLTELQLKADLSETQPVSADSLPLPTGAATEAKQDTGNSSLASIDTKTPALVGGREPTEPLGIPGVSRQLAAGESSVNTALTSACRRVSMRAVGADIRYAIGSSSQTASATSHLIGNGERLDVAVPVTPNIAVIRAGSTSGTLELTELI